MTAAEEPNIRHRSERIRAVFLCGKTGKRGQRRAKEPFDIFYQIILHFMDSLTEKPEAIRSL